MAEEWKDIQGYEGKYQVSTLGRVKSLARIIYKGHYQAFYSEKIMIAYLEKNGYLSTRLYDGNNKNKKILIHRIVAQAFLSNPEKKAQVNHKNGDKTNNRIENLEWATCKENINHAIQIGIINNKGENNAKAKLTDKDASEVKRLYLKENMKQRDIAKIFNISQTTVWSVVHGRVYSYLK